MDPDIPPAVHRTVLVVDVERFSDHSRTNPHRLTVREALYRILRSCFAKAGIEWADCHHEDRGDGVLVLVPPEVAKSLFVEHLPGEFTELLDEHNAAHGPGEQIRLRMAVHAGEIYYDAHGVVGQAVNLAYRLVDSPVLKAVLTESTNALAMIASKWFYEEVVLHSMTVDATSYRPVRVHVKETDTTAWIRVADGGGDHRPQPSGPQWTASDESARRLGARRTAYPLDLSIAELHTRGLYVPATFSNLTRGAESASVEDIVTEVEAGSSVLILGEPGSGKSVACYALLRRLRKHTPAIPAAVVAVGPVPPRRRGGTDQVRPGAAGLRRVAGLEPRLSHVLLRGHRPPDRSAVRGHRSRPRLEPHPGAVDRPDVGERLPGPDACPAPVPGPVRAVRLRGLAG